MFRDDINLVKQLVKKFGSLSWASNVGPATSHVVSGEGKRTLNLLKGLLQGCWLVSKVGRGTVPVLGPSSFFLLKENAFILKNLL